MADSRHFLTSRAIRLRENSRSASALATFLPRIRPATRLSFCGEIRSRRATALASFSESALSRARLPIVVLFTLRARSGRRRTLGLPVGRMAVEGARRRELAKLVSNHFLGDAHRDVLLTVVDAEGQADELRQDRRTPAPHLDDFVPAGRTRGIRLLQQVAINERAFPYGTRHVLVLTFSSSARGGWR